jgi:ABC-type transport system involved in cytochrome c biogenesis permease subunit
MADLSVLWLRVAAALYSLGLLHAILTVVQRRERLFRVALGAFAVAAILHAVSIVNEAILTGHFPANNFYESLSLCALLITVLFLFVYWRYKLESLSVFIFPLVFVMTLVSTMANPVSAWSSPMVRNAWLIVHVVLVLLGYAALLFTAVGSVVYLFQERELKSRKPRKFYYRLPPLGTLDDLISKSMALGFVFITLAIIAGSTWAFVELKTRWIAEPKIAISFFTWGIYMAMVFFRVTAGWRGRKAAILSIAVLGCSAITWAAHAGLRPLLMKQ